MKIGILTYHRAYNNGAYLQACALCGRLNEEPDIEAEIIDFRMEKERRMYDLSTWPLKSRIKRMLNGEYSFLKAKQDCFEAALNDPVMVRSAESLCSDDPEEFARFVRGRYDVITVGSDEVWKVSNFRGFPNPYWLIGDLGCRKFSYAASARVVFEKVLSPEKMEILKKAAADFEFVSVRDEKTKEQMESLGAVKAEIRKVADPSFVYDFDIADIHTMDRIAGCGGFDKNRKTVLVMVEGDELAEKIRRDLAGEYNTVALFHRHKGYICVPDIGPLEWLSLIRDADFVVSSLFHGACFSIIRNTPFLSVEEREKEDSKLAELLDDDRVRDRYVPDWRKVPNFRGLIENTAECNDFKGFAAEKRESFRVFLDALRKE